MDPESDFFFFRFEHLNGKKYSKNRIKNYYCEIFRPPISLYYENMLDVVFYFKSVMDSGSGSTQKEKSDPFPASYSI